MKNVAGKVAFVTGGASGIGLGIAGAFVGAGMKVVLADLRQDHISEALRRSTGKTGQRAFMPFGWTLPIAAPWRPRRTKPNACSARCTWS
jgi:NAD(P)-dependent dehydrogenase (short-subunit alcohol dehydrogenase family)